MTSVTVGRMYVRFAALPTADFYIMAVNAGSSKYPGIYFKLSDSKLYTAIAGGVFGASGISVTTGVWYRIDVRINTSANPWLIDGAVDGISLAQLSTVQVADTPSTFSLTPIAGWGATTADLSFDDFILSQTSADYPIGSGYVNHFVPTSDGTHNVAGGNDFERGTGGVDITNATIDSYLLVDDIPMDDTTPDANDFITCIAPPNSTDYTENKFGPAPGISIPSSGPRAVDVVTATHQFGTGVGVSALKLNDNGTEDTVWSLSGAGETTIRYGRKHYAAMVGGGAWTAARFNNLRIRFGYSSDPNPDQYFDCAMIEAEFAPAAAKQGSYKVSQAIKRASFY